MLRWKRLVMAMNTRQQYFDLKQISSQSNFTLQVAYLLKSRIVEVQPNKAIVGANALWARGWNSSTWGVEERFDLRDYDSTVGWYKGKTNLFLESIQDVMH